MGILGGYHDPWHPRSHASLVQINVFHFFLIEELLEHVDPVSLQIGHQCLLQAVSRLLHFPLVLADHCLLVSSVKSEERLLVVVGHVMDVDVRLWAMGSKSQHAASALCAVRPLQLCLGGEANTFLIEVIVLLCIEVVAELDLREIFPDRLKFPLFLKFSQIKVLHLT